MWTVPALLLGLMGLVFAAQYARTMPDIAEFITAYPGSTPLPADAPIGIPAWVAWQHYLNSFFLLFLVRTGLQLRSKTRPAAFWTRSNEGLIRTKNPPVRIGLPLWFHLVVDSAWVFNGIVYFVLLVATGQWVRLVPLDWDVFPHAVSVAIQYASLDWPTASSWTNYNALQVLSYFATVFIAGPLALITGLRLAPGFAARLRGLDRAFSMHAARRIHSWTLWWFIGFTIVHVTLVLTTGAFKNLNYMYAGRNESDAVGLAIFASSLVVMAVAWVFASPSRLADLAEKSGTVRRMPPAR